MPKTRVEFWTQKFSANIYRDRRQTEALIEDGWSVLVIWECETKSKVGLAKLLSNYMYNNTTDVENHS